MSSQNIELVLDIETIKKDLDADFTEYERTYLNQYDSEDGIFADRMALYPHTGEIAAIGAKNIISQKGFVIFQAGKKYKREHQGEQGSYTLYGCSDEKGVLTSFWKIIRSMEKDGFFFNRLITFNGKSFDIPYIFFRSAAQGVEATHSLGLKGHNTFHLDLQEETCFYKKIRKFNLELNAKALGIPYHKNQEYNGKEVWKWFADKNFEKIAHYCFQDVEVAEKIYLVLKKYWKILF
ncbi:MAG: hypothetical protein CVV50_03195 [Spirochaetae bacterium HGW-Spirochaetae-6]|jgi:uncharacterized protein YprB with RNaseH-like and TPR domain|nr:MAG: hypothetical protein CVV50_03195 [Spirochaetae bacterium HGW-Spirochaetae-6]